MTDRPAADGHAAPGLAERCERIQPSATSLLFAEVAALKSQGVPILGLHVGEPDEPTPPRIVAAAQHALAVGATRYTPTRGLISLREAICADSHRRRGVTHTPEEVVVSVGAKQSLFHLALALFGPGDEVIVPSPCWVSYPDQLRLSGAEPVVVPTVDSDFKLTPTALRAALTPRTRGLILCSPNNPTGAAYTEDEFRALAREVVDQDLWIIVDEIYSELVYDGFTACSWLTAVPELRHRSLVVDGVSKRFAMTGFRIGWLLGPKEVARACEMLQSQSTTSAATVTQHAALAALTGADPELSRMHQALAKRRERVLAEVARWSGVTCRPPEGAFYVLLDVRERLGSVVGGRPFQDDVALAQLLLDEERVALVPGSAFLAPGYLRLSFAVADDVLDEALSRLARLFS